MPPSILIVSHRTASELKKMIASGFLLYHEDYLVLAVRCEEVAIVQAMSYFIVHDSLRGKMILD